MKKHPLVKIQKQTLRIGLDWIAKVQLRCALEGCRYGDEILDKKPLYKCMYCGLSNPRVNPFNWWINKSVSSKRKQSKKRVTSKL